MFMLGDATRFLFISFHLSTWKVVMFLFLLCLMNELFFSQSTYPVGSF